MNAAPSVDRAPPRKPAPRVHSRRVSRTRFSLLLAGLGAAVVGSVLLATGLGPVSVPVSDTGRIVLHHLIPGSVAAPADSVADQIVWQFRLPRALLGAVIGAGLALVGCALQATVRNPLAHPYLLGVSSGASLGAVLVLVVGPAAVGGLSLSAAAFAGALAAMGVVYVLAQRGGRVTPFRLVLAGVALGAAGAARRCRHDRVRLPVDAGAAVELAAGR